MKPIYFLVIILMFVTSLSGQKKNNPPVYLNNDGHLHYTPDSFGNRIPDFSFCGFNAGEKRIPDIPVKIIVPARNDDATQRIQAAIDYVASLQADKDGFRGTVLLDKGIHTVTGRIKIHTSGIVLRGVGMDKNGTTLIAAGTSRENLITISGKSNRLVSEEIKISDDYVPVNAMKIRIPDVKSFKPGDKVLIRRPSTKEWIELLGMSDFGGESSWLGWKPGQRDLIWDRSVVRINGDTLFLDAPLTTALDVKYGGGFISKYEWTGRIQNIGIENLQLVSDYDTANLKDEDHCWMAIVIENASDVWVRRIVFEHFAGSAVAVWETSKRTTIEDCISLNPVSEIGGQRRYTFWVSGQQVLVQRCYAEKGYHDFAAGFCAAGPNAFVQCESHLPYHFNGAIDSWASGVLFDIVNVDGNALCFKNRGQDAYGAGWTAANSVFWQCSAARIDCYSPPDANNYAFGAWAQFAGNGYWGEANSHIKPRSLYYAQLSDRLGDSIMKYSFLLPIETEASSSPTPEQAADFTKNSTMPPVRLSEWIYSASQKNPISIETSNVKSIDQIGVSKKSENTRAGLINIKNGKLVYNNRILTGKRLSVQWWSGSVRPSGIEKAKPHLTRFVPGRTGTGYTDDLTEVANYMINNQIIGIEHNHGLWYDRRRDDHERIRRMDGEVWPPFYELPFAHSGQELAWDGLSKYDLFKYNLFYWNRLKQFADIADNNGLLLLHHQYFQHNILEAGAHWADYPWRSANNINHTGFPEPPPYAGDKRIFMASQFYDTTNEARKKIHQAYIRQCLNALSDNSSVIQLLSFEYTGPYHFMEFWLRTIKEWEKETGKHPIIGLSATKDVQDSVLANPALSEIVDLIDIRYWSYRDDGSLYAPSGGQNLAPRQHARLIKTGKRSFEQTYRAVREYRQKYPDKAVIYSENQQDELGWAVFMAGGSLAAIPTLTDKKILEAAVTMNPVDWTDQPDGQYVLGEKNRGYIIYSKNISNIIIDLTHDQTNYSLIKIDPNTGEFLKEKSTVKGKRVTALNLKEKKEIIIWLKK